MPTFDLTHRTRGGPNRRLRLLLVGALLVAGSLALAVVYGEDSSSGSSRLGPTVTAALRDLAPTLEASGSLQRSDEHVVAHASALPADGGDDPSESPGDDGDSPATEPVEKEDPTGGGRPRRA
jgi:hypothetical protein